MKSIQNAILSVIVLMSFSVASQQTVRGQDEKMQEMMQRGQELVGAEEFGKAAEQFQKCVDLDESYAPAWFFLGYSLHMNKQLDKAIVAHEKAANLGDEGIRPIATYNLGCAFALLGQPEKALKKLEEANDFGYRDYSFIINDPDMFSLHTDNRFAVMMAKLEGQRELADQLIQAQELIDNRSFEKAVEIYRAVVKKFPDNDFACYRLGYSLHGAGKLDEAIKYHKQSTEFPATAGIGYYNWGCALSLQGENDKALEMLDKAVEKGFLRLDAYENDPDLNNLRGTDKFKELVDRVRQQSQPSSEKVEEKAPRSDG